MSPNITRIFYWGVRHVMLVYSVCKKLHSSFLNWSESIWNYQFLHLNISKKCCSPLFLCRIFFIGISWVLHLFMNCLWMNTGFPWWEIEHFIEKHHFSVQRPHRKEKLSCCTIRSAQAVVLISYFAVYSSHADSIEWEAGHLNRQTSGFGTKIVFLNFILINFDIQRWKTR
jgi:hypothetical protein